MLTISVITICKNAENTINNTLQSMLKQSYKGVEYIICDGDSTDNTKKIIMDTFTDYCQNIKFYSERDFGIYNAMNRGIAHASGNYVIFLNAGDEFYDENVLENLAFCIARSKMDIYYGMTQLMNDFGSKIVVRNFQKEFPDFLEGLMKGRMPCHQSIIARTDWLRRHYFNEQYRYRADFEWLVSCYKEKASMEALDFVISKYDCTGLTSRIKTQNKMRKETERILEHYFPLKYKFFKWLELLS